MAGRNTSSQAGQSGSWWMSTCTTWSPPRRRCARFGRASTSSAPHGQGCPPLTIARRAGPSRTAFRCVVGRDEVNHDGAAAVRQNDRPELLAEGDHPAPPPSRGGVRYALRGQPPWCYAIRARRQRARFLCQATSSPRSSSRAIWSRCALVNGGHPATTSRTCSARSVRP